MEILHGTRLFERPYELVAIRTFLSIKVNMWTVCEV